VKYSKRNKQQDFINDFGENLRKIRLSKNISQLTLANEADISISQIQRIEYGEINPSIAIAKSLADALEIDVIELFKF
jgi:transcriptional regulator with XRE-family HTH domain